MKNHGLPCFECVASEEDMIQFGHGSIGGARGYEVLQKLDIEKFGRKAADKAVRL